MPITPNPAPVETRYFVAGTAEVLFVATIANKSAPTFAELDGGTDLTDAWAGWSGWTVSTAFQPMPGLRSRFVPKIAGRIESEDSSIDFYADKGAVDLRTLLARDTSGFIVIADGGLAEGIGDVYPVTVASLSKARDAEDAGKFTVAFAITGEPAEDVTLPQS